MPPHPIMSRLAGGAAMCCDTYHRHLICTATVEEYDSTMMWRTAVDGDGTVSFPIQHG